MRTRFRRFIDSIKRQNEEPYRQFYLPSDLKAARSLAILIAIAVGAFIISDYILVGFSTIFFVLLALRIVLIAVTFVVAHRILLVKTSESYDKAYLVLILSLSMGILFINTTRPLNFLPQVIIVDIGVLLIYLVVTTRYVYQVICASIFSIGQEIILLSILPQAGAGVVTAAFSILLSNLIGAFISWQIHSYRWEVYYNTNRYKESQHLATVGQTAGMVGHDIRNPLQAMLSDVYLIKDDLSSMPHCEECAQASACAGDSSKKGMLESLQSLEENISYVNKIVQDLQDYARPLTPSRVEVDIERLFQDVLVTRAVPKSIRVTKEVKENAKKILTDHDLLKRALTNLVNNAVQAMPNGGNLDLQAYRDVDAIIITVQDTGNGIPEEIKPKLFTPLFTTKSKGQGFGLAVVKRMAEALGGSISFESQLDKGTKFIIKLPA